MKPHGAFRIFFGVFAMLILVASVLAGCSANVGKRDLCRYLSSSYEAQFEYVLTADGQTVTGEAFVARTPETLTLSLVSPEPYDGISVIASPDGGTPDITIAYAGVRAEVPKAFLGRLCTLLALWENRMAYYTEKADAGAFSPGEDVFSVEGLTDVVPYQVSLATDEGSVLILYDVATGTPLCMTIRTDDVTAEARITKIKQTDPIGKDS